MRPWRRRQPSWAHRRRPSWRTWWRLTRSLPHHSCLWGSLPQWSWRRPCRLQQSQQRLRQPQQRSSKSAQQWLRGLRLASRPRRPSLLRPRQSSALRQWNAAQPRRCQCECCGAARSARLRLTHPHAARVRRRMPQPPRRAARQRSAPSTGRQQDRGGQRQLLADAAAWPLPLCSRWRRLCRRSGCLSSCRRCCRQSVWWSSRRCCGSRSCWSHQIMPSSRMQSGWPHLHLMGLSLRWPPSCWTRRPLLRPALRRLRRIFDGSAFCCPLFVAPLPMAVFWDLLLSRRHSNRLSFRSSAWRTGSAANIRGGRDG